MTDTRIAIAQDLSAIEDMYARLRAEAVNRAGDPDIPGGAAMVLLGPGADVEAWGYVQLSSMFGRLRIDREEQHRIEASGIEPPLSFLASWADIIRAARGQQSSTTRAVIAKEVAYIRSSLDWMLSTDDDGEPWWLPIDDFTDRLHNVRRTLENVLHDGVRHERIRARCNDDDCEERPRLHRVYGSATDGSQDHYRCPACSKSGDAGWVAACWHRLVAEKGDPPEWVSVAQAAAATGRPPKTIHRWTETRTDGTSKVAKRDGNRGTIEVNWLDARIANDTSSRRPYQIARQIA